MFSRNIFSDTFLTPLNMRTLLCLYIILFSIGISHLHAKTWRVNNMPNTDPDFSGLQAAHDGATNGDTILLEGSPNPYSGLICTKRLVIIGPGYFLWENPSAPSSHWAEIDGDIRFAQSFSNDPSSGSAGSILIGIVMGRTYQEISIETEDVVIARCYLYGIEVNGGRSTTLPATGAQIIQNYFAGGDIDPNIYNSDAIVNIQILNNIFVSGFDLPSNSSGSIRNNLFIGSSFNVQLFVGEIRNNILTTSSEQNVAVSVVGAADQLSHNVSTKGQFGIENNNLVIGTGDLFVGPTGNSTDGQWQLKPNSPASGNGSDGTDRGPFGGINPYRLSGLGAVPAITFMEVQPVGSDETKLQVKIKAVSSN
jgi:hypothetical protein